MKILAVSDTECAAFWDYYIPGRLKEYDLILSCGDLKADYLSFLVTMARAPLLYVHGNHDTSYAQRPPEGCSCIDDCLVVYNGVRILGLGGCYQYHPGEHQYTENEMRRRIRKLRFALQRAGGVDIVVSHAPPNGLGDGDDPAHRGFQSLVDLVDTYHPQYLLHGHVHRNYMANPCREYHRGNSIIINTYERYTLELPDREVPAKQKDVLLWKKGKPRESHFPPLV